MKREFSAGGVVLNSQGQVLLIKNMAMRDPKKSYWGFPKGHLEAGEGSEAAAVREIKEETGLEVKVLKKLGTSQYVFNELPCNGAGSVSLQASSSVADRSAKNKNGEKVFKSVTIFLMEYLSGSLKLQTAEIQEAVWFDPQEAKTLLSFKKDLEFLNQALEIRHGQ